MEINLKSLGKLLPQLEQLPGKLAPSTLTSLLQTGIQLSATVLQDKGNNRYLLEVFHPGTQTSVQVNAQSITTLEPGHPLQLEVVNGGAQPQARIVRQQAMPRETPMDNVLRQFLPQQQELSSLVNHLASFAKSGAQTALPADIQQLARSLLESLPDKNTLSSAEGLKQAVRDSGLFLESKLAHLTQADAQAGGKAVDPALTNDLKAKLLVLAQALTGRATPSAEPSPAAAQTTGTALAAQAPQAAANAPGSNTATAAETSQATTQTAAATSPPATTAATTTAGQNTATPSAQSSQAASTAQSTGAALASQTVAANSGTPTAAPLETLSSQVPLTEQSTTTTSQPATTAAPNTATTASSGPPTTMAKNAPESVSTNDLKAQQAVPAPPNRAAPSAQPNPAATQTTGAALAAQTTTANAPASTAAPLTTLLNQAPPTTASAGQPATTTVTTATPVQNTTIAVQANADQPTAVAKHATTAVQHNIAPSINITTEPALQDLVSQTEGALAKLVLNQLASLPQTDANQQIWRLDIPFTLAGQPESAKLEIEREANKGGHAQSDHAPWAVIVELNPPGLGKLGGKLTLSQGTINAFFWSENPTTAALVHDNLPLLQARLEAVGLKTGQLNASIGVSPTSSAQRPRTNLLDLHA